ncbi:MAG TPA: Hsp20/alpha crystallin family protein [Solirubrobacteraceae bacterium]
MPERDLFAGFDRMRREMDELFGDVLERSLRGRRAGFSPRVDVSYAGNPPRAIVTAELAGVNADEVELEVHGRELVIAGHRGPVDDTEGRVFQQIEIEHGPFRRTVQLGAEVAADAARATYHDGILRVELPLQQPEARAESVPVEVENP